MGLQRSAKYVGATSVRVATLALAVICTTLLLLSQRGFFLTAGTAMQAGVLVSGVLAAMGLIHCFKAVYSVWMRFAEFLQTIIVTTLFGVVYLAVVPFFFILLWPMDPLRLRTVRRTNTFWIRKHEAPIDLGSLQRMG